MGCDAAQGFVISKPLPEEELLPWLGERWIPIRQGDSNN